MTMLLSLKLESRSKQVSSVLFLKLVVTYFVIFIIIILKHFFIIFCSLNFEDGQRHK